MTTAEKREKFKSFKPELFKQVYEMIDKKQFRELDSLMQETSGASLLQYVITLLCDELTDMNNEEIQ